MKWGKHCKLYRNKDLQEGKDAPCHGGQGPSGFAPLPGSWISNNCRFSAFCAEFPGLNLMSCLMGHLSSEMWPPTPSQPFLWPYSHSSFKTLSQFTCEDFSDVQSPSDSQLPSWLGQLNWSHDSHISRRISHKTSIKICFFQWSSWPLKTH